MSQTILFIFSLFFMSNLSAECKSAQEEKSELLKLEISFIGIKKELIAESEIDWWSASEKQVAGAKCQKKRLSPKELSRYFNTFEKVKGVESLLGIKIVDESPELIKSLKDLLVGNRYGTIYKGDYRGKVPKGCLKVQCIVEGIFGKKLGPKLLYLKQRFGLNGSHFSNPNSAILRINEVDAFIKSATDLPSFLLPLNRNKQMTRFKRGYAPVNQSENVLANATITFFDAWRKQPSKMREYTAFHELSHYVASEFDLDENEKWMSISGWEKVGGVWKKGKSNLYTSKYGVTNSWEDFAESMAAYRFNPAVLKKASPLKYQFIKETVFHGLEYTSANKCQKNKSDDYEVQRQLDRDRLPLSQHTSQSDREQLVVKMYQQCPDKLIDSSLGIGHAISLRDCFVKSIPIKYKGNQSLEDYIERSTVGNRFPELTRSSLKETLGRGSLEYSPEERQQFYDENYKDSILGADLDVVNSLVKLSDSSKYSIYLLKKKDITKAGFCPKWIDYASQSFVAFDKKSEDRLLSFSRRKDIKDFSYKVCRRLLKVGALKDFKFSPEEVKRAYISERAVGSNYYRELDLRLERIDKEYRMISETPFSFDMLRREKRDQVKALKAKLLEMKKKILDELK